MAETTKRIAIIGAGPSGLTSIKSCLEECFLPVCYERSSALGGLWRYHESDEEGIASVTRNTIINTSKEVSAFSDFPPPPAYPNYMHHTQMLEYFKLYARHFQLTKYIEFNTEVVGVEPTKDFEETGQWIVSVKKVQEKESAATKHVFDAVMVCIGHHVYPRIPTFHGQSKFKGKILHTHSLKSSDQFKGLTVAVVGIGNSGVDAAVDATYAAKQVFLSTRRGSWILGRVSHNGLPLDIDLNSRYYSFLKKFVPYEAYCSYVERICESKMNHEAYNLKPKHRFFSAHPTVNDALPNAILSGRIIIKKDIERFEDSGIWFCGDSEVTGVDVVVLATGYEIKFPFLSSEIISVEDNRINLYKYCIPPHLNQSTLAFIGLVQSSIAIVPVSELQSRWFVQIVSKKIKLPSSSNMQKDIDQKREELSKLFVPSPRHTIQIDVINYSDEISEMFGAKPNFLKMAIKDPKLFWTCVTGPIVPYQYRLNGPHAWSGAREAILTVEDRVYFPLNPNFMRKSSKNTHWPTVILISFFLYALMICFNY